MCIIKCSKCNAEIAVDKHTIYPIDCECGHELYDVEYLEKDLGKATHMNLTEMSVKELACGLPVHCESVILIPPPVKEGLICQKNRFEVDSYSCQHVIRPIL